MFAARRLATVSSHFASVSAPRVSVTASARPQLFAAAASPRNSAKVGSSFSSAASPEAMSDAKTLVDNAIKDNDVLVFSKSYCPVSIPSCCASSEAPTGCVFVERCTIVEY